MNKQFFWIYLTVFVNIIGFGMIFPLLPLFAETLRASPLEIGLLAGVFSLGQFVFAPIFGRLSDRYGRKPVLIFSIAVSTLSFLIMAVANHLWIIIFSRLLDGISSASSFPIAQSYIADVTSKEERTKYMSRVTGMFSLGFVVGPVFGGLLGVRGFAFTFLAAAGISMVNLIFAYIFLKESITKKAEKFVLREGFLNFKAIISGLKGDFGILFLLLALWAFYISNFQLAIPLFTQSKFHFGIFENGLFFSLTGTVATITQWFLVPLVVKKIGEIKTIFAGTVLMIIGQILAPFSSTVLLFYLFFIISISGSGLNRPVINALLSKNTREGQGTTLGLGFSFESLGRFVGPLISGLVIGTFGLSYPFWITALFLFIGLFIFWRVEMRKKR